MSEQEISAYVHRLVNDVQFFAQELWINRGLDRVAPLSEVELDMIQFAAAEGPYANVGPFRGILAPRGVGKTHLVPGTLTAYRHIRDKERKVLIPSAGEAHPKKIVTLLRGWYRLVPFLQHLNPEADDIANSTQFHIQDASDDATQKSVTAIGIDGQLEGNRAHSIFPDDVETDKNTITLDSRMALDQRLGEFKDILYPDIPPSRGGPRDPTEIVAVGTYHHEESVYMKMAERGYKFLTYPILYPKPDEKVLNLAPILQRRLDSGQAKPGDPVFPHRFGPDEIIKRQSEGRRRFFMQHMLVCDLGQRLHYPLKLSDLIVFACSRDSAPLEFNWGTLNDAGRKNVIEDIPCYGFAGDRLHPPIRFSTEWAPFIGTKVWIDPAGRGRDQTAAAAISQLGAFLHLKGIKSLAGGSSLEDMHELALFCRKHNARDIYIESNADTLDTYRPLFESALRHVFLEPGDDPAFPDGYKASLIRDSKITHSTRQKEIRIIDAIEPVTSNHRLIVDPSVLQPVDGEDLEQSFQFQYSRITRDRGCLKEYGKLDAVAGCLLAWAYTLKTDPLQARRTEEQRRIEDDIRKMQKLMGRVPTEPRMFKHR